jgi:IclR family acetate operon transcriptional repressor
MTTVKEIRAVRNACEVVDAIAAHQPVGVSELARETGLDKSAVHRIAVTLHGAGWIRPARGPSTRWELSPTFAALARQSDAAQLAASVRTTMERLRDETDESVLLAVLDSDRLFVAEVVESRQPVRLSQAVGAELPLSGSAAGRAIAAHLPADDRASLRHRHPTFADDQELAQVRRRGWAANDGEVAEDVRAVAAPILGFDGLPRGAFVVCGPAARLTPSRMSRAGRLAADAGRTIALGEDRRRSAPG